MSKRIAAKSKTSRGIRNLPAKALTAKHAGGVKGGKGSKGGGWLVAIAKATGQMADTAASK